MDSQEPERKMEPAGKVGSVATLLVGMGLLVLAGMNLFTNLLQFQAGQWQQNIGIAVLLTIVFAVLPGWFGARLVFRSTYS